MIDFKANKFIEMYIRTRNIILKQTSIKEISNKSCMHLFLRFLSGSAFDTKKKQQIDTDKRHNTNN